MLGRDFKLFLRCLIPTVILTLIFALVCTAAAFTAFKGTGELFSPVKVAVVDEDNSILSRLAVGIAKDTDYISELMEVYVCDQESAENGLDSGEYAAIIILPDGFIGDISSGKYTEGRIILSSAAVLNAQVVESAARFGEVMLAAGQYGVFSGEELIREYGLGAEFHKSFLAQSNAALMGEAMSAGDKYFSLEITDYADTSMSVISYYAAGWTTLVLFLCSLFMDKLCTADLNRSMLTRLKAAGVSDGTFMLGKLLYPSLFRIALMLCLLPVLSNFILLKFTGTSVLLCLAGVLSVSVLGAAASICTRDSVPCMSALSIVGLFLSGGIVPIRLLPDKLLRLGTITPFGAVLSLLKPIFGSEMHTVELIPAVFYTAVSLFCISRRLLSIRVGGDRF